MRALIFYFLGFWAITGAFAQTGPAGVGNTTTNVLWLRGDAGTSTTTNFQPVSQWSDMSGNGNHATQPTASQQPLYSSGLINGLPALFFDNIASPNNDLLTIADADNLDNTSGLTILTVTRPISIDNTNARAIISKRVGASSDQAYTIFFYTNNNIFVDIENNDNRFSTPTIFMPGRDYVFSVLYDGSLIATNRVKVYINENLDFTANESAATIANHAAPVTIASMNTGDGRPFGGYIAEVIMYGKALNVAERIIAHNYLFAKYGFSSLSGPATVNDLYAGDDAANGNYDFEVAGIGKDATGSNSSVSSSVTGGLGISIVSGADNGDYILYGHPTGGNNAQITDVAGMTGTANARWSRVWYFDITNTAAAQYVNFTFDMSDAGTPVTPTTASNYVLLRRTGQTGAWSEVSTATSIVGDQINFNNIPVPADGYFTLGSKDYLSSPLPITLRDFTGEFTEKGVEILWTTATEHNSDHFNIERSPDGEHFETIADVRGAGTTSEDHSYRVFDSEPYNDRTYYRLLQTDVDGKTTNVKTIVVRTSDERGTIQVSPNPTNGDFWVELPRGVINPELKIFNTSGAIVPATYQMSESGVSVNATNLPAGLYILKLVSDRGMFIAKFVIE